MTYILAGKLDKQPFLLVDCMSSFSQGGENYYRFTNKLVALHSSPLKRTFFTLTGNEIWFHMIRIYDETKFLKNEFLDFRDIRSFDPIVKLYFEAYDVHQDKDNFNSFSRAFFINSEDLWCYDFEFNYANKSFNVKTHKIFDNYYFIFPK